MRSAMNELLVFGTLAVTIGLFIWDRIRLDIVALMALMFLALSGVINTQQALSGFSNPIVLIIAALFVVGEGLSYTGVAASLARWPAKAIGSNRFAATIVLMTMSAFLSALMSSTGAVAVMIPVAIGIARTVGMSASQLLMPMAFAAQIGGTLTLIGTPPNIVASNALKAATGTPFHFFAFAPFGLAALVVGLIFVALAGTYLLPEQAKGEEATELPSALELAASFGLDDTLHRSRIAANSPLVDQTLAESRIRTHYCIDVVQIEREHHRRIPMRKKSHIIPLQTNTKLLAGDVLSLHGGPDALARFQRELLLEPIPQDEGHLEKLLQAETGIAEVLLTPNSRFCGKTLKESRFRSRFGVTVLSIKHMNELVEEPFVERKLAFGDSLLVTGPWENIEELREARRHFIIATEPRELRDGTSFQKHAPMAISITVTMLIAMSVGWMSVVAAAVVSALAMVLTGCVRVEGVYRSINWPSVVLIAAMLPMATALEVSGGLERIVGWLSYATTGQPAMLSLGLLMVATSLLSQFISNTATAVLMAPIGAQMATQLSLAPTPFLMGIALASSTAFATPVASPVNTLVLGPGDYRFKDFLRCGIPLQVLLLATYWLLLPLFFKL